MILGIDASTPGSGGGKRHLIELLKCFQPEKHGFSQIKIWGVNETLSQVPDSINIEMVFCSKIIFYNINILCFVK